MEDNVTKPLQMWSAVEISESERDKWVDTVLCGSDGYMMVNYVFSGDTLVVKITREDGSYRVYDCKVRRLRDTLWEEK